MRRGHRVGPSGPGRRALAAANRRENEPQTPPLVAGVVRTIDGPVVLAGQAHGEDRNMPPPFITS